MTYGCSNRHSGTEVRQAGRNREGGELQDRLRQMVAGLRLWRPFHGPSWGVEGGTANWMPRMFAGRTRLAQNKTASRVVFNEAALRQPKARRLSTLWRARDNCLRGVAKVRTLCRLGSDPRLPGRSANRPQGQRSGLFTRELPVCDCFSKSAKPLMLCVAAASLASCAAPVVQSTPNSCSTLLPADWKQGVDGADLPDGNTVGDWIAFGDAQTGRLDVANGRTKDAIEIVERCEERDAAAVKKATRGFFGRLFH